MPVCEMAGVLDLKIVHDTESSGYDDMLGIFVAMGRWLEGRRSVAYTVQRDEIAQSLEWID